MSIENTDSYDIEKFLIGVDIINRAKKEIEVVVTGFLKFADEQAKIPTPACHLVQMLHHKWCLRYDTNGMRLLTYGDHTKLFSDADGYMHPESMYMMEIRQNLQWLMDGMVEHFPAMLTYIDTFIKAAKRDI